MVTGEDVLSEIAVVSIRQFDETTPVSGHTRIQSMDFNLGERTLDMIPLLNGGYLEVEGLMKECEFILAFRPITAILMADRQFTTFGFESGWDIWAGQADISSSNAFTGDTANIVPSKRGQKFRISVLLGEHDMLLAETPTTAENSITASGLGTRITFAECTLVSAVGPFSARDGWTQRLLFKFQPFDRLGQPNILIEQKKGSGTLPSLGLYDENQKWGGGYTTFAPPGRL